MSTYCAEGICIIELSAVKREIHLFTSSTATNVHSIRLTIYGDMSNKCYLSNLERWNSQHIHGIICQYCGKLSLLLRVTSPYSVAPIHVLDHGPFQCDKTGQCRSW